MKTTCSNLLKTLIFLTLFISIDVFSQKKAEKKEKNNKNEWDKIKEYGSKINNKTREKY